MKNGLNFLIFILVVLLTTNLVFQSCQKSSNTPSDLLDSTNAFNEYVGDRSADSISFYVNMLAKTVAHGLNDASFQTFFKKVSARNQGNEVGFSLWNYRDSLITSNQTLAGFLSYHSNQVGYNYSTSFFRGHLVRYIPNLSIGISIWGDTSITNYVFSSNLKVAALPLNYYSDDIDAGNANLYDQSLNLSVADVDNANYDFVFVDQNPYLELFKTSNNKSLDGDKTVPELHGFESNSAFNTAFATDVAQTTGTLKFRLPGTESISGTNCYLVDKSKVFNYYEFGAPDRGPGGGNPPGGGGDPPGPGDNPVPCTGDCERDNLNGQERVRFVQMVDGKDCKKKFNCKKIHPNCTFRITQYRFELSPGGQSATLASREKVVNLWEKTLRKEEWVWWNDQDNKFVIWNYCTGELGNQMFYNVIGVNPKASISTTYSFSYGGGKIKFEVPEIGGFEVPIQPTIGFSRTKAQKDFDFGETETVYYCDPCNINQGQGNTYSTGTVRLRIRELE